MRLRHLSLALAAMSLTAAPALAAPANPASSLSVAKSARAATPTKGNSKMVAGTAKFALIGFLVVVGAVVLVTQVLDNDDSDSN